MANFYMKYIDYIALINDTKEDIIVSSLFSHFVIVTLTRQVTEQEKLVATQCLMRINTSDEKKLLEFLLVYNPESINSVKELVDSEYDKIAEVYRKKIIKDTTNCPISFSP